MTAFSRSGMPLAICSRSLARRSSRFDGDLSRSCRSSILMRSILVMSMSSPGG